MRRGILYALGAAACFGAGAPFSKLLLERGFSPLLLAGLLYLGSALVPLLRLPSRARSGEKPLRPADWRWLLPGILCGGVAAPALLATGLQLIPASQTSLLLCLESAFTAGLAWTVFGERGGRRVVIGLLFLLAGSALLSFEPGRFVLSWGALLVAAACLAWALDNNFTKQISDRDPVVITMWKGLLAGPVNIAAALLLGAAVPKILLLGAALLIGAFSYGLCLEWMIASMRRIGAARMGAWFSTAPFTGALLSIALLGERPGLRFWAAGLIVACGLWLYATEKEA